jgi:hypothetical protein
MDFQEKLIEIFTTIIFYLKLKEKKKMTWLHMLIELFFVSAKGIKERG